MDGVRRVPARKAGDRLASEELHDAQSQAAAEQSGNVKRDDGQDDYEKLGIHKNTSNQSDEGLAGARPPPLSTPILPISTHRVKA